MRKGISITIFIFGLFILLVSPHSVLASKYTVKVVFENANIRLNPDEAGPIIEMAPMGAILDSDLKVGTWYRIKLPPDERGFVVVGYVHSSMVEVINTEHEDMKPISSQYPVAPAAQHIEAPPSSQQNYYPAYGHPPSEFSVSIQFYGGMNYLLSLGDFDDGFQGIYQYRADDPYYEITNGQYQPLHFGQEFGGSVWFNFTRQFGLKLGAGYLSASKESLWKTENGFVEETYTAQPAVKVIPLTVSLFLNTSPVNQVRFFIHAGIGYYLGMIEWNHIWQWEIDDLGEAHEDTWNAKSNAIGYQGGLGLEINIGSGFSFVMEGLGRYVQFNDILGELTYKTIYLEDPPQENSTTQEDKTFWYTDCDYSLTGDIYPMVLFREDEPSGSRYNNVRKGIVDLTGFSARAGFKIRF